METSLHRDLKRLYAGDDARLEVRVGRYRIDAVCGQRLVEIQHGSLAAIRDKIRRLLVEHEVTVVKPIVARKLIVRRDAKGGEVVSRRSSPKRGGLLDVFHELVHFTRAFPHPRLALEVPLIEIEEWRYPGHGRRRRWRSGDCVVEDQKLITVRETHRLATAADLVRLISCPLPPTFHTGHLAEGLGVPRWIAQRIAYCLRQMGAVGEVGKAGNARLYQLALKGRTKKPRLAV
jgi:hypothetical protein